MNTLKLLIALIVGAYVPLYAAYRADVKEEVTIVQLQNALEQGKWTLAKKLLGQVDINQPINQRGDTLLSHFVLNEQVEAVKFLIKWGADVSAAGHHTDIPLTVLARKHHFAKTLAPLDIIKSLLKMKTKTQLSRASYEITQMLFISDEDFTLNEAYVQFALKVLSSYEILCFFSSSIEKRTLDKVGRLLKIIMGCNNINDELVSGFHEAFEKALEQNDWPLLEVLLRAVSTSVKPLTGNSLKLLGDFFNNLLREIDTREIQELISGLKNYVELEDRARLLLEYERSPHFNTLADLLIQADTDKFAQLGVTWMKGSFLKYSLEKNVDIDAVITSTPFADSFSLSLPRDFNAVFTELLSNVKKVDLEFQCGLWSGIYTPLRLAIERNNIVLVKRLLDRGADVNKPMGASNNALLHALQILITTSTLRLDPALMKSLIDKTNVSTQNCLEIIDLVLTHRLPPPILGHVLKRIERVSDEEKELLSRYFLRTFSVHSIFTQQFVINLHPKYLVDRWEILTSDISTHHPLVMAIERAMSGNETFLTVLLQQISYVKPLNSIPPFDEEVFKTVFHYIFSQRYEKHILSMAPADRPVAEYTRLFARQKERIRKIVDPTLCSWIVYFVKQNKIEGLKKIISLVHLNFFHTHRIHKLNRETKEIEEVEVKETILHIAARLRNEPMVRYILSVCPALIALENSEGITPLQLIADLKNTFNGLKGLVRESEKKHTYELMQDSIVQLGLEEVQRIFKLCVTETKKKRERSSSFKESSDQPEAKETRK